MKLRFDIEIGADVATVWDAFDDPDNLPRWQDNLVSFSPLSGTPGQPGAVAELVYDEGGREVTLKETVMERREPDFRACSYDTAQGTTLIVNHFVSIGEAQTRWSAWCNYTFTGVARLLAVVLRGRIRARTERDMQRFKLMVESDCAEISP